MTSTVTMHIGDVRDVMRRLIAEGALFDFLVTSPPFYKLRSYLPEEHESKTLEIGAEPTPGEFLNTLYQLTDQWSQLLPEWASICVELGDKQAGSGGAGGDYNENGLRDGQAKFGALKGDADGGLLSKSMMLLPHAYTIGLAYGHNPLTGQPHDAGQWRIRNVITWARPNPPVGSLGKRNPDKRTGDYKFRPACSFITVACRGTGRYCDLDAVRTDGRPDVGRFPGREHHPAERGTRVNGSAAISGTNPAGAPPLDWHADDLDGDWLWKLATAPYPGSHYATYPLALPRRLVLAMCPASVCSVCGWPRERVTGEATYRRNDSDTVPYRLAMREGERVADGANQWKVTAGGNTSVTAHRDTLGFTDCGHDAYRPGHVLDPFGGSGTTAVAAALEQRDATLIDLDARNADLVRRRLAENVRIVSEHHDGDSIVWTVEQVTKSELVADAGGQMDLFAS
jgi:hypothetical protein